ncbi:TetR/AcrR family transcriptional regulator [Varunaivibrio sulfuroxidans]|uniref:TetR family transcriptional regulator n=1 Tax=Varunaivibrio sulfuroxidans TaxID=1773489 RepID=A0A4R3JFX8_9PROT|nr:TetR family transcriptional regulator [Varunaivibrio sulfuroxidans]TCS64757.1 TetR family transcriptional regulator [Varunaivibrio sulfuroxidans]WES29938.1 TetR family transcriptional regulator [Varunaivibrio sulfuroxidans]
MRDAGATRRRILDAARVEFSNFGLAGARINRIAAASGANKERIYANFGSKEGLFDAVMSDTLAAHAETVGQWGASPEALIDRLGQAHEQAPDLLRLMLWEALQFGGGPVPDEERRRQHYRRKAERLKTFFGIEDSAKSAAAMLTLIGLAAWPSTLPQLANMLCPPGEEEAFEAAQRDLLHRLAKAALEDGR